MEHSGTARGSAEIRTTATVGKIDHSESVCGAASRGVHAHTSPTEPKCNSTLDLWGSFASPLRRDDAGKRLRARVSHTDLIGKQRLWNFHARPSGGSGGRVRHHSARISRQHFFFFGSITFLFGDCTDVTPFVFLFGGGCMFWRARRTRRVFEGRGLGAAREREKTVPIFLNDGRVWWAEGAGCAVDLRSQLLERFRVVWEGGHNRDPAA